MVIRSGKHGPYRYYVCHNKATAGADICRSKSIREDALDSIILDGLRIACLRRTSFACTSQKFSIDQMRPDNVAEGTSIEFVTNASARRPDCNSFWRSSKKG